MAQGNQISVLRKMFGLGKKKPENSYIVPQNSKINLDNKPAFKEHIANLKENNYDRTIMNKCPHCENMAKNFLYLESLIRNNCDKNPKCSLCQSSLKYLQYVNRNIMQVFGNFDSIVQAARVFSTQVPPSPKYSVRKPPPKEEKSGRSEGGAHLSAQKSTKSLKPIKSQKSKKSIKSSKSGKALPKSKTKTSAGAKSHTSHGKMVLKSKFKSKPAKSPKLSKQLNKVVRSASQYQNLRVMRSKVPTKTLKAKKQRGTTAPTSINWSLLKRNMPKHTKSFGV
ncbi:PREDICTED: uncharacterized protein LOC108609193 [Drosophila arizonae]|uniref:Uncharacterized protein LOC108609193 n=1 Tax=Drosophila arizonae TaxID=7263 RepID=A0ABM1NN80_DROAR|nr:PREDICTED: uncharacterized protein LOC108609193 [Drosophila arizonae]